MLGALPPSASLESSSQPVQWFQVSSQADALNGHSVTPTKRGKEEHARYNKVGRNEKVCPPRPPCELATVIDGLHIIHAHALGPEGARPDVEPSAFESVCDSRSSC